MKKWIQVVNVLYLLSPILYLWSPRLKLLSPKLNLWSPRPNCGLIAFLLHFWLHPSQSSGVSSSGSFHTFYPIQPVSEITPSSASSPSCTCGLSDRSCGSLRRCSPSSVASGWFFSTRPSPRSVTQSGASSGPLQGLFSPPEQQLSSAEKEFQRRSQTRDWLCECYHLNVDHHSRNSTNAEFANVSQDTKPWNKCV